jgi:DNA-binding SARP family transcriptional activator
MERRHGELAGPAGPVRSGIAITTLGRLSLTTPQGVMNPESWKSQRAVSMFVYLAIRAGRETSKDRLIELFWPGKHMRRAARNFHPTLSYARRALRGVSDVAPYLFESGAYVINPALNVTVDVRKFEGLVNEARSRKKKADRLAVYEQALGLYRGDFMEGRYEPWTEEIRTQLGLLFEGALAEAAALYYEAGDYHRASARYEMLLQRSPYQEEIHARLMMCYHKAGDQAAIRAHYQRLIRILHEDLGVEPLPETSRVYRSLVGS